jgi:hypothetical protein
MACHYLSMSLHQHPQLPQFSSKDCHLRSVYFKFLLSTPSVWFHHYRYLFSPASLVSPISRVHSRFSRESSNIRSMITSYTATDASVRYSLYECNIIAMFLPAAANKHTRYEAQHLSKLQAQPLLLQVGPPTLVVQAGAGFPTVAVSDSWVTISIGSSPSLHL